MAKEFHLTVLSPTKSLYNGKVVSLVAPAALGYLGILADHAPLIAGLKKGKIMIKESSGGDVLLETQTRGFLEVKNNNVTIILDRPSGVC
jgi:F-type H+-transporting ATPase subunit epsilon